MPNWLYVFLISMLPIVELRGAIPAAAGFHAAFLENAALAGGDVPFWLAYIVSVIGNMIPVPFILFFIVWFLGLMQKCPVKWISRFAGWIIRKGEKAAKKLKYGAFIGLFLFVAIPFPGTGAWTGSLIAALMGFDKRWSALAIFGGVLVAGVIMTLGFYGGVEILQNFG